jgi:hypothetical protein
VLGTVAVLCWGIDKPQHLTNVIHWWWAHAQVCSAHSRGDACICACAGISACVSRVSKLTMRARAPASMVCLCPLVLWAIGRSSR